MPLDLTLRAVQRQLSAMGDVKEFEIGILNQKSGQMMLSRASAGQVVEQINRLKRENARGNNVYIRPARDQAHPYVLMDDLDHEQVAELKSEGFESALVMETSPKNHQCLIKMPSSMMVADRKTVERALQKRFGSDPASADGQHFLRLAGFTNQKPRHERNGKFPYVIVKQASWSPVLSPKAAEWLAVAPKLIDLPDARPEQVIEKVATRPEWYGKKGELAEAVAKSHQHLQIKYVTAYNPSIADFQIAKTLLRQGWNSDSVREGLRQRSPDLDARKVGHVDDYLDRTLSKITGRLVQSSVEVDVDVERPGSAKPSYPRPGI